MSSENMIVEVSASEELEHRLVHLDLKGAPPKISYYEWLFPLLHKWGATGLLIEYEDMFPYSGLISDIAAPHAYQAAEIEQLLLLANQNKLIVIPLIQTFGHFEFVLKHDKFRHLREVEQCPMTLCPSLDESFQLLTLMIDQIVALHPEITWLHIGADEVFHIGLCTQCRTRIESSTSGVIRPVDLFLSHVKRVLDYIRTKYSTLRAIMWDDMLRHIDLDTLKLSCIGELVEPMVWYYSPALETLPDIWQVYSSVFAGRLWAATAYKGATGPCMTASDINYHVENQKEWLRLVEQRVKLVATCFRGYALTGWQRYDHYAVLCELLPVGLPSLAICLLTITNGSFTLEVHRTASFDLQFSDLIPMNPYLSLDLNITCAFNGSEVYMAVVELLRLKLEYKRFMRNDRLKGWMTQWHVRNNYSNPAHVNHFLPDLRFLVLSYEKLSAILKSSLANIFYADTVEEWMSVNITPNLEKLKYLLDVAIQQVEVGGRVKRESHQQKSSTTVEPELYGGSK